MWSISLSNLYEASVFVLVAIVDFFTAIWSKYALSINMFLVNYQTPYFTSWGYDSSMHQDIKIKIEKDNYFDIKEINSLNEFNQLINNYHLSSLSYIEVEFQYFKDINLFKEEVKKEYSSYKVVLLQNLPYENNFYSLIFKDRFFRYVKLRHADPFSPVISVEGMVCLIRFYMPFYFGSANFLKKLRF